MAMLILVRYTSEEEQLIRITVTEPHGQRSQDGIGRIVVLL